MAAHLTPEQLDEALRLRRRCWTQQRIAEHLGVSQAAISRGFARVDRPALKRLRRRALLSRVRQVEQLERIAEEAAEAWERSKQDLLTIKMTDEGKGENRTETTRRRQPGIPAFLAEARAALADVRKVLGIDDIAPDDDDDDDSGPSTIPDDDPRFAGYGGQPTPSGDQGADAT